MMFIKMFVSQNLIENVKKIKRVSKLMLRKITYQLSRLRKTH